MRSRIAFVGIFVLTALAMSMMQGCPNAPQPTASVKAADSDGGEEPTDAAPESFTLRYIAPATSDMAQSSAAKWGVAAPVTDGFSDPNKIAYNDEHAAAYAKWVLTAVISCGGPLPREVVLPDGEVASASVESTLGQRFRAADLARFLETRIEGKKVEREYSVDNPHLIAIIRKHPQMLLSGRLRFSPWELDIITATSLLSRTRYKPAYPLMKRLLDDPSDAVRYAAVMGLGDFAKEMPEALDDLRSILPDKKIGPYAIDALKSKEGLPVIIEAINHENAMVRNHAVFALPWIPVEDAMPGVLVALEHADPTVRNWGVMALLDIQTRGNTITHQGVLKAIKRRSTDPADQEDTRRCALAVLQNLQ